MSKQRKPSPTSFTLRLAPKQTLVAQGSTITPPGPTAYLVNGTTVPISTAFVKEWLRMTLTPLVGQEAIDYLENNVSDDRAEQFFEIVQRYLVKSGSRPRP